MRWSASFLVVLAACVHSAPPHRASPLLDPAEPTPAGRELPWVVSVNAGHTAWVYQIGAEISATTQLELHDGAGPIATTALSGATAFDVAADRTAVVCGDDEVRQFDGATWATTSLATISADGDRHGCVGIASRARGDLWILLRADDGSGLADHVCRLASSTWTCIDTAGAVEDYALVLTAGRAWWLSAGSLFAVDAAAPGVAAPAIVAADAAVDVAGSWLQADPTGEAVLVTSATGHGLARIADAPPPERIAFDGTRTALAARSEYGGYADVWMTRSGAVRALDVAQGTGSCSGGSGPFTYSTGSGSTCAIAWTQLVVYDLGAAGGPVELGHADYDGGSGVSGAVGVERGDGSYVAVSGDGWYRAR